MSTPKPMGSRWKASRPNAPPAVAPRKREGAKIPPEPPEPSMKHVAITLRMPRARSMKKMLIGPANSW